MSQYNLINAVFEIQRTILATRNRLRTNTDVEVGVLMQQCYTTIGPLVSSMNNADIKKRIIEACRQVADVVDLYVQENTEDVNVIMIALDEINKATILSKDIVETKGPVQSSFSTSPAAQSILSNTKHESTMDQHKTALCQNQANHIRHKDPTGSIKRAFPTAQNGYISRQKHVRA
jgi:hypothetical protein